MSNLYVMLVGRICGEDFHWDINAPYVPQVSSDDPDAAFDAPSPNNFSFFGHLVVDDEAEQTAELEDDMEDRAFWARWQW